MSLYLKHIPDIFPNLNSKPGYSAATCRILVNISSFSSTITNILCVSCEHLASKYYDFKNQVLYFIRIDIALLAKLALTAVPVRSSISRVLKWWGRADHHLCLQDVCSGCQDVATEQTEVNLGNSAEYSGILNFTESKSLTEVEKK